MKKHFAPALLLIAAGVLFEVLAGCAGPAPSNAASPTQHNPAVDRMGSLAGMPPESAASSGGVLPNLAPMVEATRVAAANAEANSIKTAARAYLADHTAVSGLTSDDLQPLYVSVPLKARYYLDPGTLLITRVEAVSDGWIGIVFSLSEQKWVKGAADNDHPDDQDVP